MAKEFKLPDLGEGIHEGEVLDVKVDVGDQVEEDQTILEVETDKAAVEIPSPYSDVVTDIRVEPGDIVRVGEVMMVFGGAGDNVAKEKAKKELAERAREGAATLEDMQGSTITITNVGPIGGTGFAPIINYPEVAILGLARADVQPVAKAVELPEGEESKSWEDGYEFVPRLMLPVVLSFDHTVNDGAEAQRFLNRVIELLENPERLLLGL